MNNRTMWSLRLFRPLVALVMLALPPAPSAQAAVKQIPGTRVTVDVPDGYEPIPNIERNLVNKGIGVGIMLAVELPGQSLESMIKMMSSKAGLEGLAIQGGRDLQVGKLERADRHAYIRLTQSINNRSHATFMLIFGASDQGLQLIVTVAQDRLAAGTVQVADIERILASARIVAQKQEPPELFQFGYLGSFKVSSIRSSLSGHRVFLVAGERTFWHVVPLSTPGNAKAEAMQEFEQRFMPDPKFKNVQVAERRRVQIAGMAGFELVGRGNETSGTELGFYQVALSGKDMVYLMLGTTANDKMQQYLPEFRKIAGSLKLN